MSIARETVDVRRRNNVAVLGNPTGRPIVFAHGFGCSQTVWTATVKYFLDDFQVVLFDLVGAGNSDLSAYDRGKYDSLDGYAEDLLEILDVLDLQDTVFVGHSVSAMVGVLAATRDPSRFGELVLVGPSPRYLDDAGYSGGFTPDDIDSMLDTLDANYLGWSSAAAPLIVGNPDRPELGSELAANFCSIDPAIARHFARVTFTSDNRRDLEKVITPTLILQSSDDIIAPPQVGSYVHEHIRGSRLRTMSTTGHCPNLSDPAQLAAEIIGYLG